MATRTRTKVSKAKRTRTSTQRKKTKTSKPADNGLALSDYTTPPEVFTDYVTCIYGESGIGKTSLVAQFPGAYFFQFDPERKGISVRQSLIKDKSVKDLNKERPTLTPWEEFDQLVEIACNDDEIEMIVIDNFGLCYMSCLRSKCFRLAIPDPNAVNDFGQTWRDIRDELTSTLHKVMYANKGLILISHDTEKEVELPSGTKFDRVEPAMMKAAFGWIKACTDFGFYFTYGDEGERTLLLRGDKEIWTKCSVDPNHPRFHDPNGEPLKSIDLGTNPAEAYKLLMQAWENEVHDIDYVDPKAKEKSRKRRSRGSRKVVSE